MWFYVRACTQSLCAEREGGKGETQTNIRLAPPVATRSGESSRCKEAANSRWIDADNEKTNAGSGVFLWRVFAGLGGSSQVNVPGLKLTLLSKRASD